MTTAQRLRVLARPYLVDFVEDGSLPADGRWTALVRAPEGLTVVREAPPATGDGLWAGLYGGETAHGPDTPGMLAALVGPLAQAGIAVFVASTFHADLLLVPYERLPEAVEVLRGAGHEVDPAAREP
ncbi:ACT domain-containing protein [Actinomadura sp. DC4]|uniref:ACT domain-containing protein n=1 Tax=Actinomadura sp. DC4 TaxID=3055069 RepID=UPI0025AFA558|nr:ACT domain-containing protein [Actinomadura sp. DC4]MDN3357609.1 ACT domain-containing protein [Actinomadura sp. DC4]